MRPRLYWFIPLLGVVALLIVAGVRLGDHAASLTETDVIETYAARYVAENGGQPTDCVAFPGQTRGIWIVVRCSSRADTPSMAVEYHVNRLGGLEYSGPPKPDALLQKGLDT